MDRNSWTPLTPTQRHSMVTGAVHGKSDHFGHSLLPTSTSNHAFASSSSSSSPSPPLVAASSRLANRATDTALDPFAIGRLPSTVIQKCLENVPLADLPNVALASRSFARFIADERLWANKLIALSWHAVPSLELRHSPDLSTIHGAATKSRGPTTSLSPSTEDEFGDFEQGDQGNETSASNDDFGGFASAVKAGQHSSSAPVFSYRSESSLPMPSSNMDSAYQTFKRIAVTLKPFIQSLAFETSPTSSLVFSHATLTSLESQAYLLCNIARFVAPGVLGCFSKPLPSDPDANLGLVQPIQQAADYLEGILLSAFEGAEARRSDAIRAGQRGVDVEKSVQNSQDVMKQHANLIWQLANATQGLSAGLSSSSLFSPLRGPLDDGFHHDLYLSSLDRPGSCAALSFLEKRTLALNKASDNPDNNFVTQNGPTSLDFTAMDSFITQVLASVESQGSLIAQVFPAEQLVLLAYGSRIANEVLSEYIQAVLTKARSVDVYVYLQACAATFTQALRLADTLIAIEPRSSYVTRQRCDAILYSIWDHHLEEYLNEERDWIRQAMQNACQISTTGHQPQTTTNIDAAFLNSQNPAAVKRSVLSGFKDILLMPVTIVPRAAGAVGGAVIRTAGSGLSQLNPLKWQASLTGSTTNTNHKSNSGSLSPSVNSRSATPSNAEKGYMDFSNTANRHGKFQSPVPDNNADDDDDQNFNGVSKGNDLNGDMVASAHQLSLDGNEWSDTMDVWGTKDGDTSASNKRNTLSSSARSSLVAGTTTTTSMGSPNPSLKTTSTTATTTAITATEDSDSSHDKETGSLSKKSRFSRLQMLLSLDTALQLIQLNRESLKRVEIFKNYPSPHGQRVKDELEEISVIFFQCLSEGHVTPGFARAADALSSWDPTAATPSSTDQVAPLTHFFELVHVADTIQQMVQVYFDSELSIHIDKTNFLNGVVREKKKFENNLDEAVANGLNIGVDLLMKRAEWILSSQQNSLKIDFYFADDDFRDVASPTHAAVATVDWLQKHCQLLIGATDPSILEIFYHEIGLRLFSILCKHVETQLINLNGGFQLISDLNYYATFISHLKIKSNENTVLFASLKQIGNLFIISDSKELVSFIRDLNSSVFKPEEVYDFLKARSDFKLIEKSIDKEMYGWKAKEDCLVM